MSIAELSEVVAPAAADLAGVEEGAGVLAAGGEVRHSAADVDITGGEGGLVITDVAGVAVAELAMVVQAPATHLPGAEERAGVEGAGGELDGAAAEVDVAEGGDGLAITDVLGGVVAELAEIVTSPAADEAGIQEDAGVVRAGRE